MLHKPAETLREVHQLIRDRWSPRAFDPAKSVSHDDLVSVLEAARWTASSNNVQPWRFIVATRDDPQEHAKALQGFNVRNQRWAKNAPVLIFALARKVTDDGAPNGAADYDTGAAVAQLVLQAAALGLSVHQAGGVDKDKIRQTYGVPEEVEIMTGLGLGYQGDPDILPDELPARERAPRTRKPLGEIAFTGAYGEKIRL